MVTDLNIPAQIVIGETKRGDDGLATSSRNRYLTTTQHAEALNISKALQLAHRMVHEEGVRSVDRVVAEITHHLSMARSVRVIYVQVVDRLTMKPAGREIIPGQHMVCVAAWLDQTRLIDNIAL